MISYDKIPFKIKYYEDSYNNFSLQIDFIDNEFQRYLPYLNTIILNENKEVYKGDSRKEYDEKRITLTIYKSLFKELLDVFYLINNNTYFKIERETYYTQISVRRKLGDDDTLSYTIVNIFEIKQLNERAIFFKDIILSEYANSSKDCSDKYYGGVFEAEKKLENANAEYFEITESILVNFKINHKLINHLSTLNQLSTMNQLYLIKGTW